MTVEQEIVEPYFNIPVGVKITEKRFQNLANEAKYKRNYRVIDDNTSDGFVNRGNENSPVFGVEYKSHKTGKKTFISICKMLTQQLADSLKRFSKFSQITLKSILLESPCFVAYVPVHNTIVRHLAAIIKPYLHKTSSSQLWKIKLLRDEIKEYLKKHNIVRSWRPEDITYDVFLNRAYNCLQK